MFNAAVCIFSHKLFSIIHTCVFSVGMVIESEMQYGGRIIVKSSDGLPEAV